MYSPHVPNSQYDVTRFHSCFMIWWFVCYYDWFILSSLKLKFWGAVGCVLNVEGKLEFPSELALVLVSYWTGDRRLSNIYTNSSHACYYEWLGHATLPTRARTPNRIGSGRVRVRVVCAHDLRTRMQFDLGKFELENFCFDFIHFI